MQQLNNQRSFFNTGITKTYEFRLAQLKKLKAALLQYEDAIYDALYTDLKRSKEETWMTEIGFCIIELNRTIKKLSSWMSKQKVATNLLNFPSKSYIIAEPLGVVLIISPWNYPLQLAIMPLIGAIAAGNCIAIKGSEHAAATDALLKKIIESTFAPEYISYHTGDGAEVVGAMMDSFSFDHIFYTGSTAVGRLIYKKAADKLIPVTLELGGKSPCIVAADANLAVAAKRIVVTKYSNCGQMCVAPDYILVHESKKDELITQLKLYIEKFHGADASASYQYGRIINAKQYERLVSYLQDGTIAYGGQTNADTLYIQPTILTEVSLHSKVMQEEIFGPILPVIGYKNNEEALAITNMNKNPLAFYVFTASKETEKWWMNNVAFGGGCVNNTVMHLTNHELPFGGRGFSGIGAYHGKKSFDVFSHHKSIMRTPTWIDPAIRYPPYKGKLKLFKRLMS